MSTFAEINASVRTILDDPDPQKPNPRVVAEQYKRMAQLLLNQAQNSANSWSINSWPLTTAPSEDTYLIAAPDFGKDVLVHTVDESNPLHVERVVPRISMQSRQQGYYGPHESAWAGTLHSAELMVFYRQAGGVYVQIRPAPAGVAEYKIWYDTALIPDLSAGSEPILPISHPYLISKIASACIPYAHWSGVPKDEQAQKKKDLMTMFLATLPEERDAWLKFIATDRQIGVTTRRGFDDEAYSDGYEFYPY